MFFEFIKIFMCGLFFFFYFPFCVSATENFANGLRQKGSVFILRCVGDPPFALRSLSLIRVQPRHFSAVIPLQW